MSSPDAFDPITGGNDEPWFIVTRFGGGVRAMPANWKGAVVLAGMILGNVALGLGAGLTWAFTGQWWWTAIYALFVFPGFFFLIFTIVHRKGREIVYAPVNPGPIPPVAMRAFPPPKAAASTNPGLTVQAIDHVQLAIPPGGEDQARRFYGDLLGLSEQPKPPALAARGGCWFESAAVKVHCGVEDPFNPAHKAHVAFRVSDVTGLAARARAAGWQVTDDDALPGHDRIYINDPFGNRLEFLKPL